MIILESYLWIVSIVVYFFVLLLINEILRRYPKALLFFFGIFPFLTLPFWFNRWGGDWFVIAKVFSVWLASVWKWAIRFTKMAEKTWALYIVQFLLMVNCAEATIKDFQEGNMINAAAGFILVLTVPGPKTISVDKEGKWRDFLYNIPILWVLGYTIWNFTFVAGSYPHMYRMHIPILLAALIPVYFDNRLWNQARGFTLGGHFLFQTLLDTPKGSGFFKNIGMTEPFPNEIYVYFAITSLVICSLHFTFFLKELFYDNKFR